jgi:hypothetical protein
MNWAVSSRGLPLYFEARVEATSLYVTSLAIDPKNPAILYAVAFSNGGDGVFKSTDGGAPWVFSNLGARGSALSP